eukprot:36732-Eustigmatos_ZCMA.PRE.1
MVAWYNLLWRHPIKCVMTYGSTDSAQPAWTLVIPDPCDWYVQLIQLRRLLLVAWKAPEDNLLSSTEFCRR